MSKSRKKLRAQRIAVFVCRYSFCSINRGVYSFKKCLQLSYFICRLPFFHTISPYFCVWANTPFAQLVNCKRPQILTPLCNKIFHNRLLISFAYSLKDFRHTPLFFLLLEMDCGFVISFLKREMSHDTLFHKHSVILSFLYSAIFNLPYYFSPFLSYFVP